VRGHNTVVVVVVVMVVVVDTARTRNDTNRFLFAHRHLQHAPLHCTGANACCV
jgi:hypothetical protein